MRRITTSVAFVVLALLSCVSPGAEDEVVAIKGTITVAKPLVADAAEQGDWETVRKLVEQGESILTAQADGMTALHWATWQDKTAAATFLLRHKAKVDAENRYGLTPLFLACENGNATLVQRLLDSGANPNAELRGGETVLMMASRTGNLGVVKALLTHNAKVNERERKQQTAIMWAAAEGHADVVEELLRAGADFKDQLKSGYNPLFFAAREGRINVVKTLLDAGVDVNSTMQPKSRGGRTVRRGTSSLILAIENGHYELAVRLLEAGADPDDQRSGFTPLHTITWARKPNLGDGVDGEPAPYGSGSVTSLQFVEQLVRDFGADVNRRLEGGSSGRGKIKRAGATPFLFACDTADLPLMKLLLKLGADPTIANADGCPPILPAAGYGTLAPGEVAGNEEESLAAVRLLLELGADINAVDKNGETAMHGAAYASFPRMVDFLATHGHDIGVWHNKNKHGWTPLLIAEGHRPGNFKPAAATIEAVRRAMIDGGVQPPKEPRPRQRRNRDYEWADKPAAKKP